MMSESEAPGLALVAPFSLINLKGLVGLSSMLVGKVWRAAGGGALEFALAQIINSW